MLRQVRAEAEARTMDMLGGRATRATPVMPASAVSSFEKELDGEVWGMSDKIYDRIRQIEDRLSRTTPQKRAKNGTVPRDLDPDFKSSYTKMRDRQRENEADLAFLLGEVRRLTSETPSAPIED